MVSFNFNPGEMSMMMLIQIVKKSPRDVGNTAAVLQNLYPEKRG